MTADMKAQQRADAKALRDLMAPVAVPLNLGRILAVVAATLAVVPYIALVHIGDVLLSAERAGAAVDGDEVGRWVRILIATFALRLAVYLVALLITHFADSGSATTCASGWSPASPGCRSPGSPRRTPDGCARRCRTTSEPCTT